jgi:hypothetical protein
MIDKEWIMIKNHIKIIDEDLDRMCKEYSKELFEIEYNRTIKHLKELHDIVNNARYIHKKG